MNMMKWLYLVLCIVGTILPWSHFGPWFLEHGLSFSLFFSDAFANRISSAAWLDLIVAATALLVFVVVEGRRQRMKHLWAPFIAVALVGVSLALPLFLLLREHQIAGREDSVTRQRP